MECVYLLHGQAYRDDPGDPQQYYGDQHDPQQNYGFGAQQQNYGDQYEQNYGFGAQQQNYGFGAQ